jgi:GNAT superfamily N-acetyltransferase
MTNVFEVQREGCTISTDKARLNIPAIYEYLSERSYWAEGRSREVMERAIENSLCFGIYDGRQQAGFARVVTDYATFAWLADVFTLEDYRGRGLSKWLVQTITAYPPLATLGLFVLATRDAHELYRRYGDFELLPAPEFWMRRRGCG